MGENQQASYYSVPQTPEQLRAALIESNQRIEADHRPVNGLCPVCKVPICRAWLAADRYLISQDVTEHRKHREP